MTKHLLTLSVIASIIFSGTAFAQMTVPGESQEKEMEMSEGFFIPKGNAAAGREAFVVLKCVTCHTVNGDSSLPAPISANPGPMLRKWKGDVAAGEIMDAVVSPSHQITGGTSDDMAGEVSNMGDFADTMTVRQLINITAYLTEPLPEE